VILFVSILCQLGRGSSSGRLAKNEELNSENILSQPNILIISSAGDTRN
jgi:hypothetical protein